MGAGRSFGGLGLFSLLLFLDDRGLSVVEDFFLLELVLFQTKLFLNVLTSMCCMCTCNFNLL